jgi:catechol 2,3-dioxygenase-like lactoylglutathione lyase family enzyme
LRDLPQLPRRADAVTRAVRIARVSLTTAELERAEAFYRDAFGFAVMARRERSGPAFATLTGVSGGASVVVLRLGGQEIDLVQFAEPGRPYPIVRTSNDPWFQHIAIVVSDMRVAYARLTAVGGWTPITRDGPQRLPANTGGVTAFKFRDPEGHPLELLEFAAGAVPQAWRERGGNGPCLGIDHSAIVVDDSAQSISFYGALGFAVAGGSLNRGVEQARLDDLTAPVVDVTSLAPRATEPPRIELLHYRVPPSPEPMVLRSNDVAATRLVLAADGSADLGGVRAALRRDPDGHHLLLVGEGMDAW